MELLQQVFIIRYVMLNGNRPSRGISNEFECAKDTGSFAEVSITAGYSGDISQD